jgi:hypothetical protein
VVVGSGIPRHPAPIFSHGQTTFHNVDFTVAAVHKKISLRKMTFHIAKQEI